MALINRVSRLFRADMHAILDRIEEPEMLLRQAIREMEESILENDKQLKLLNHDYEQLLDKLTGLEQSTGKIEEELDLCFDAGNDELARTLVRRKLEADKLAKIILRKRDNLEKQGKELTQKIEEQRTHLENMQQKLELLSEQEMQRSYDDTSIAPELAIREDEVEVAFLREQQKRKAS